MLWSSASIEVRQAAAQCVKNILATQSGVDFWEQHKDNRDPMLAYLNPFRKAKKKVCLCPNIVFCMNVCFRVCSCDGCVCSVTTDCRPSLGGSCECRGEFGGQGEAGESGVLDSPGGQPQGLAEGSVHHPAGQWRSPE